MINLMKFILTSLLLGLVYCDPGPIFVPGDNVGCPNDFGSTCDLQCPKGNYLLDDKGCPTCACVTTCPEIKCRANCDDAGYEIDENGCQTCKCILKPKVECSRVLCRMYCSNGFKRNENGCEYCACNELPQECPQLNCDRSCSNDYRKDYSGCQTCDCQCAPLACPESLNNCKNGLKKDADGCDTCACEEDKEILDNPCIPIVCDLQCKYGYQRDENGCNVCACNSCPMRTCRMFCMYGFRKNPDDGCDICECDWTPVAEKIQCDERIPCQGTRVCNLKLRLCEIVNPDQINWFLYDFEVESEMYKDERFVQTFKNGFIRNVAAKYGLEITQITVSSVEDRGLTSFQIMPFFNENMEIFENKMDQIDIDLNTHEFRNVLPAVANAIEDGSGKNPSRIDLSKWCQKFRNFIRSKTVFFTLGFLLTLIILFIVIIQFNLYRRRAKYSNRSESKTAIYDDTSYQLAPSDDDHCKSVHAPDGTRYIVVASDDTNSSNDKRAMV